MQTPPTVDVLNELLTLEQRMPAHRFLESTPFVPPSAMKLMEHIKGMARDSREHAGWLTDAILQLGGSVGMRVGDPYTADLHYQDLRFCVPRLVAAVEALIQAYSRATSLAGGEARVVDMLSRIIDRHRQNLATLGQLASGTVATEG